MAEPTVNNPTGRKPSDDIPAIRTFQLDAGGVGEATNHVNLFRGNLTYPLDLVTLPGRNGVDAKVTAVYQSNVDEAVAHRNGERPTGTLGLGWLPPFEAILCDDRGSAARSSHRFFLVTGDRSSLLAADGGRDAQGRITFQATPYAFWSIAYDPGAEMWEVVHEDGTIYRYGGADLGRGTVQWGVSWGAWVGASSMADGQGPYATGWNLAEIEGLYGDRIEYAYDNVEQGVGGQGPRYHSYTKASYLKSITDVFGRTVAFRYDDKRYSLQELVCEYDDPHRRLTSPSQATVPNAYQSRYETRYLAGLDVTGVHDEPLFSVALTYDVRNLSGEPKSSLTYPFLAKRFLTGVTLEMPDGSSLPGYEFEYAGIGEPNPGALSSILYPNGGSAVYTYERQQIAPANADRRYPLRTRIDCPLPGVSAKPRVWFGPDYTVVTWHDAATGALTFSAHRWLGSWALYRAPQPLTAHAVEGSLRVEAQSDFFCLTWTDSATLQQVTQLYRKDPEKFGSWTSTPVSMRLDSTDGPTTVASGDDFIVFCNAGRRAGAYWGWYWSWQTQSWQALRALPSLPVAPTPRLSLVAAKNFYVAGSYVPGTGGRQGTLWLALFHRDPTQPLGDGWSAASTIGAPLTVLRADDPEYEFFLLLSPSDTSLAATYITGVKDGPPQTLDYDVRLFSWDEQYRFVGRTQFTRAYHAPVTDDKQRPPVLATFANGPLFGNSGNLIRYVGGPQVNAAGNWVFHDHAAGVQQGSPQFAYGRDAALIQEGNGTVDNVLVAFDPAVPSAAGFAEKQLDPGGARPTIAAETIVIGPVVYTDVGAAAWSKLPQALPGNGDYATTLNRAPSYAAYDTTAGTAVDATFFRNGGIGPLEVHGDPPQQIATPADEAGTVLAGVTAFVTYPAGSNLDDARTLYLNRVVHETASGPVIVRPVVKVDLHDPATGAIALTHVYAYDESTVAYDPANRLAQYSKVTLLRGDATGTFGRTVSYFSNGVATNAASFYPPRTPVNYSNVLTGQLLRQELYSADGTLEAASTTTYAIFKGAARSPGGAVSAVAWPWVRPAKEDSVKDGVRRTTSYTWSPFSGQRTRVATTDVDAGGAEVDLATEAQYAYEVDDYHQWMLSRHALDRVVQTTKTVGGAVIGCDVTTWKQWRSADAGAGARWASAATYRWRGVGDPRFDFSAEPSPSAWLRGTQIVTRADVGLVVTEQEDVDGRVTSSIYDRFVMNALATFPGASMSGGEATYYGFEADEVDPGWRVQPGGGALQLTDDGPATGQRCLVLAPGDGQAGPQLELTPADRTGEYLLSCAVRTAPSPGAAWVVSVIASDGSVVSTSKHPFPDTGGAWQQLAIPVDLASVQDAGPLTLRLRCVNAATTDAYVDDVRFSPRLSDFAARVFDPTCSAPIAELGPRGEVQRKLLDRFRRERARSSAGGAVALASDRYLRRMDADAAAPDLNSSLRVYPAGGGFWGEFDSTDAGRDWDLVGSWSVDLASRTLRHVASPAPQRITLRPQPGLDPAGVRVEVLPPATPAAPVSLTLGAATVKWDPSGQWVLAGPSGTTVASAPAPALVPGDWMLVGDGSVALFFFNGRQVFQHDVGAAVRGTVAFAAQEAVAVRGVLAFEAAGLTASYDDGFGRVLQSHVFEGPDWIVTGTLYDAIGRTVVTTKPVRRPPDGFGWWPDFVADVDLDGTGRIGGALARYYAPGGGGQSDDDGYAFRRTRYGSSPLDRVVEQGQAGPALAIDPRVPEAQRHTTRTAYAANEDGTGPPAGTCFQTTTTDPNGNAVLEVANSRKQVLARKTRPAAGVGIRTAYDYTARGDMSAIRLPNAHAAGADPTAWTVTSLYDFFGHLVEQTSPDLGVPGDASSPHSTRMVYDRAGRIRFRQTPQLARAGEIAYSRYDALGRVLEEGLVAEPWDIAVLQNLAEKDPAWPGDVPTWCRRYEYDGSPSNRTALLRLTAARSKAASADASEADEAFGYDLDGRPIQRTLTVPGFDDAARTVDWSYDGLGRVLEVGQAGPEGTFSTHYGLDRLGLVRSVGTSPGAADVASFDYNADSTVSGAQLATKKPVDLGVGYDSPGWVTSLGDAAMFQQTVRYTPDDTHPAGYYDGSVAQSVEHELWSAPPVTVDRQPTYDGLGRLTRLDETASDADGPTQETLTYDPNGNLRTVAGATSMTYTYDGASDRVINTDGSNRRDYGYDLDGNVIAAVGGRQLTYDAMTGLPATGAVAGGATVAFTYDAAGTRVLRDAGATRTLSVPGLGGTTVAAVEAGGDVTYYVYGPTGLLAAVGPDGMRFFIKDQLGSVRAVVNVDAEVVAAFRYSVWGAPAAVRGSLADSRFLFTGQEWDPDLGLYNFRARLYDPVLRRFYSQDPASQFASPYLYAANNPFRYIDPTGGQIELALLLIIGLIIGAVSGLVSGIATAVQQKWSVGEAIWRTILFTVIGAATGLLAAAATPVGEAVVAGLVIENAILQAVVRGATATVFGLASGVISGSANAAASNSDPAAGAAEGALTSFIGSSIGAFFGEAASAVRSVAGLAMQEAGGIVERGADDARQLLLVYDSNTLTKGAAITFAGGFVGGAVGTAASYGGSNEDASWQDVLRDTLLGGFLGGFSAGWVEENAVYRGSETVVPGPLRAPAVAQP